MVLDELFCFVEVEREPFPEAARFSQPAVLIGQRQVDFLFQLFGEICFNPAHDFQRSRRPDMRLPEPPDEGGMRVADFGLPAIVKKIYFAAHKIISLLTARESRR